MTPPNAIALTKVALLIDGDNVSATFMPIIMREAEKIGTPAVRRIYGQFKSGRMKSWEKPIALYELTPVNVSPLTRGKNATDMKLVIEAMDMLYGRQLDALCIASSDGDFTPLVARARGNAIAVYGFGAKKAPAGYKAEFDRFFECDTLLAAEKKAAPRRTSTAATSSARAPARPRPATEKAAPRTASPPATGGAPASNSGARKAPATPPGAAAPSPAPRKAAKPLTPEVEKAILSAVERAGRSEGRATLRAVGNALARAIPDFHARDYGYANTKALMQGLATSVEIIKEDGETYIRRKPG